MSRRHAVWLGMGLGVSMLCILHGVPKSATAINLRQIIKPLDCVVTTVIKEDGSRYYVLPPQCGKLTIAATKTAHPKLQSPYWIQPPIAMTVDYDALSFLFPDEATPLDSLTSQQPIGGYVLLAYVGDRYSFRLWGDPVNMRDRVIEVVSIGDYGIRLRIWPEGQILHLDEHQAVSVDVAYGPPIDMRLQVVQLNADGSVLLRVQFNPQPQLAETQDEKRNAIIADAIFITIFALGLHVYTYDIFLRRRAKIPSTWWVDHPHSRLP